MMRSFILALASLLICCGCSREPASAVPGGTEGSLKAGDIPVAEFELKIYEAGKLSPVGVGITDLSGNFRLLVPTGQAPLWLSEGDYIVTLESVGAGTPRLLPAYRDPAKSPLKVKWTPADKKLEVGIPAFK